MTIIAIHEVPKQTVSEFFQKHWGSTEMVISSGIYDCSDLAGFAFMNEQQMMIGLITYIMREGDCEIISLDSTVEGKGIGSALVKAVEQAAVEQGCTSISLITTNDNLHKILSKTWLLFNRNTA